MMKAMPPALHLSDHLCRIRNAPVLSITILDPRASSLTGPRIQCRIGMPAACGAVLGLPL